MLLKYIKEGWQGGLFGKDTCQQAWEPEFDPQNPNGRSREYLSSDLWPPYMHVCTAHSHTHMHMVNKCYNFLSKYKYKYK